ncbi:hypothetical protein [Jeotgalibacillus haloalkalitolerans]|uniref:Uncharacterized protein n=1 Tax=Jeotgalibacillus haloalkalitolerans TaxID=3104292 RepID=A0ABU5KKE5_9BACL|nr:hypothetical protein [Jeotgalibacillus sp. HH7-29]MDZ5711640.1 hypothetical protein [Jeotgalibacillus sp. HH7-29]
MTVEELYEAYLKAVKDASNGLVTSDKAEFFKMVAFREVMTKYEYQHMKDTEARKRKMMDGLKGDHE